MAEQLLMSTTTAGKDLAIYQGSEYIFKCRSSKGTTMRCISERKHRCNAKIQISLKAQPRGTDSLGRGTHSFACW